MSFLSAFLPLILTPNPSHLSFYHYPLLPTFSAILTAITYLGILTPRKTNQAKICLTGFFLLISYLLTTPIITPYYTAPLETAPPLIFHWFLPTWPPNAHGKPSQTSAQITFLSLSLLPLPI